MSGQKNMSQIIRRRKLETELLKTRDELLSIIPEKSGAESKLDRLLSLKGQLSVSPAAVHVDMKDVRGEYDFGAFRILRCRDCFVYKTVPLTAVVHPVYNGDLSNGGGKLYATLEELCSLREKKDGIEGLTDDEKNAYEIAVMFVSLAFSFPVMIFSDMEFAVDCYKYIMDRWVKTLERISDSLIEETDGDIAANRQFEEMVREAAEEAAKKNED